MDCQERIINGRTFPRCKFESFLGMELQKFGQVTTAVLEEMVLTLNLLSSIFFHV